MDSPRPGPNPDAKTRWFVAQLRPNGLRLAETHLRRQGFAVFAPMLRRAISRGGKWTETTSSLFPGYLFVGFDPSRAEWAAINSTRGVSRLIGGTGARPAPLPDRLIAGLMARCDSDGLMKPPEDLSRGDRIRILSGPFADYVTTVETLDSAQRVNVLIGLMGRAVRATLARGHVEKLG